MFNAQKANQFGSRRDAVLFKPGTYSNTANVGYYTSVAGLGLSPDDVTINGDVTVDAFNASEAGNATQNFWRSTENLSVVPSSGTDRWAVAQAGPFRRMHIKGGLNLFPASYGWASGGYIADSKIDGKVASASQQQWYSRDSNFGSWEARSGTWSSPASPGPRPRRSRTRRSPRWPPPRSPGRSRSSTSRTASTGCSCPPAHQRLRRLLDQREHGRSSIPMSQFYVVKPGDDAARINQALAQGLNLFFTPGVYHLNQTLNVTRADTVVLGIGLATLIPDNGSPRSASPTWTA